jgi:hypothetical protein
VYSLISIETSAVKVITDAVKETGLGITTKNLRVGLADLIAIPTVLDLVF